MVFVPNSTTLLYPNGNRYDGPFITNLAGVPVPHGYGTMSRVDGEIYSGSFFEGRRHGQGYSYHQATQRQYTGGYVDDREEGYGMIIRPGPFGGQQYYLGQVYDGLPHGRGMYVETASNGSITRYEGQWSSNQLTGPGKLTITEFGYTTVCEGTFVNWKLEGWGFLTSTLYGGPFGARFQSGNVTQWAV